MSKKICEFCNNKGFYLIPAPTEPHEPKIKTCSVCNIPKQHKVFFLNTMEKISKEISENEEKIKKLSERNNYLNSQWTKMNEANKIKNT